MSACVNMDLGAFHVLFAQSHSCTRDANNSSHNDVDNKPSSLIVS